MAEDYATEKVLVDEVSGTYADVTTAKHVISSMYHIPNFKDANEWYAGGTLRNQTMPGGSMFSTDRVPSLDNKAPSTGSYSTALFSGSMLAILNGGYTSVAGKALGGALDLIADFDVRSTTVITYRVIMSMSDGTSYTLQTGQYTGEGDGGEGSRSSVTTNSGPMNLRDIQAAYGARIDISNLSISSLDLDLVSDVFSGKVDLGTLSRGALLGTVGNTFKSRAIGATIAGLGITSIAGMLAVGFTVGAVFDELTEMALGLDISFGPGGELQSTDEFGFNARFSPRSTFMNSLKSTLNDTIGTSFDVSSSNYTTDRYGNINSTTDVEGRVSDFSGYSYGVEVASPASQVAAGTPSSFTDMYSADAMGDATTSSEGPGLSDSGMDVGVGRGPSGDGLGSEGPGSSPGEDESSNDGYGGGGTVICTALAKHGVFTRRELVEQMRHTRRNYDEYTYAGYLYWAQYAVNSIGSGKQVAFWSKCMASRWNYLKGDKTVFGCTANFLVVSASVLCSLKYRVFGIKP